MIPYFVPNDHRRTIFFIIAVAAVATWYLLHCLFGNPSGRLQEIFQGYGGTLPVISALSIYGGYFFIFDRSIWRLPLMRNFLRIPDLRGKWVGERFREDSKAGSAFNVTITQTWSHIQIESYNARTTSRATSAAFVRNDKTGIEFLFTYHFKPSGALPTDKSPWGDGTQTWKLSEDGTELRGRYYSTNTNSGEEVLRRAGN